VLHIVSCVNHSVQSGLLCLHVSTFSWLVHDYEYKECLCMHVFNHGTPIVTPYLMYFKLLFYRHFIFLIGSVTSVIVSSFNFCHF
jgi:hypothetical protein